MGTRRVTLPAAPGADRRVDAAAGAAARPFEAVHHLRRIMRELADLMAGRGAMLTLHAGDGRPPAELFVDGGLSGAQREAMLAAIGGKTRPEFQDGCAFWREGVGDRHAALFVMPIDRLAGHGRLVIGLLLDRPNADARAHAERLYRERRPFATGFFQIWQQNRLLEQRARALESVLDRTEMGLILLDRASHVVFTNRTADEILATGDGIGRVNDALRATSLIDGVNLQAALTHVIGGDAARGEGTGPLKAPLLAFHRRAKPPLIAAVLPAQPLAIEASDVAAVLYLVDPQLDTAKMLTPLCRLYGLSVVETNLVCHLAAGETIASAALAMHVKEQTARSYLKAIFIKTATRRQTELVVLMLSSLIRMKRDVLQEALTSIGSERALGLHD